MIVCSCNVVTDAMIKSAIDPHCNLCPRTPGAIFKCLGCSPNCGRCFVTVRKILIETLSAHTHQPHLQTPACDGVACEGSVVSLQPPDCDAVCDGNVVQLQVPARGGAVREGSASAPFDLPAGAANA